MFPTSTGHRSLDRDRLACPSYSIQEIELKGILEIFSRLTCCPTTVPAKRAEHITEQVLKRKRTPLTTRTGTRELEPPATLPLLISTHFFRIKSRLQPLFTKFVIQFPFLLITQDIVSKGNLLETFLSRFVSRINIRM